MKTVAIIEARMTSSRLPGKVLLPAAGKPMLEHLVDRLKKVPSIDQIVLATTVNSFDDMLEDFAASAGINCFRGSEVDVMDRVIKAASSVNGDIIVEITGDCPIIDPIIVEQLIRIFHANDAVYVSNAHIRSYPDGMDTQVFSLSTLKKSAALTNAKLDREHVTLHIRNHPELFSYIHIIAPPDCHWPELGLTLDERSDYELLCKIIEYFSPNNTFFSCQEVIGLLRSKTEWVDINKHVKRKGNE